jgi:cytochrome d ubiquinol oxidase subunit I
MDVLDLARLQFAVTTLYHFIFVPVSIGLAAWTAICQTAAFRTKDPRWDRAARFWGKLFLVSFVLGVATGIVQEFQFGMGWSGYSRYVGDVFGAPLAMEALIAFFLESTFLGLWLFGRDRLSPRLHLASIWAVAVGSMLSVYFILAANAWMQQPVGFRIDQASGRAEMTSIWEVLTNTTALLAFPHTIFAAWATAAMVVVAVAAWHLRRGTHTDIMRPALRTGLGIAAASTIAVAVVGHFQGMHLVKEQPMKMAAAEALFETQKPAPFSLFATGDWTPNPERTNVDVQIPDLLSFIATGDPNGEVKGINQLNAEYRARYGPGEYAPVVAVTYWSFRIMVGAGMVMIVLCGWLWWRVRRGRELSPRWLGLLLPAALLPLVANSAGWLFTEMGRQPWVVQGLLKTRDAVSPTLTRAEISTSLIGFTALYGVLAVLAFGLFARLARGGPDDETTPTTSTPPSDLALSY